MISNLQSHLESHFSMLKSLGMLGPKTWGLFYLQMQLFIKSKSIVSYISQRADMHIQVTMDSEITTQCKSLQSTCSATCIDTAVTAVSMHLHNCDRNVSALLSLPLETDGILFSAIISLQKRVVLTQFGYLSFIPLLHH